MNWRNWLTQWKMTKLQFNAHFLALDLEFKNADRDAAWEIHKVPSKALVPHRTCRPADLYRHVG